MTTYIIRRALIAIPILLGITILVFTFLAIAPGDPVSAFIRPELANNEAMRKVIIERYGLDQPIPVRYLRWLGEALQGNLSQPQRDRVMQRFRSGRVKILVATNVAARGLDVTSIMQVINFDLPETSDLLTHRIGRTGRMGRRGQAITLLAPIDSTKWRELERGAGKRIPRAPWPGARAALDATPESVLATIPQRPLPGPMVSFSVRYRRGRRR